MMICEKCATEMNGSVVTCRQCGHNHVLQRIDAWRERRSHHLSSIGTGSGRAANRAAERVQITPAIAKDSTLLRFPKKTAPPPAAAPPPEKVEVVPEWRHRLNSRLQEIRAQRALEIEPPAPPPPVPIKSDRNPIVAAALNRIQRANYLQPITPVPRSRLAVAAELTPEPLGEILPTTMPLIEAKVTSAVTHTTIIPIHQPRAASVLEFEMGPAAMDEDLLSEIVFETSPQSEEKPLADATTGGHTTLEAASLTKRFAAAVIDAEIIASSLLPLIGAYFFLGGWFGAPLVFVPITVSVLLITVYFFVTYAVAGRTMGMAWCNLHLASQSSTAEALQYAAPTTITFTFKQAALRALGGTITLLLFPLNVAYIARNDDRLSLSDYLSGTQVVRIKK